MLNEIILIAFYIAILLYSLIIHEVAHGVAALWQGDPTAKYAGRITANPIRHIDPWMTIGLPVLMLLLTNFKFAFGGAKPVPYNPYNLKNQKWGPAMVGAAGPLSNIFIAIIAAFLAKFINLPMAVKADIIYNFNDWGKISEVISGSMNAIFFELLVIIIFWNVFLAFFNLIPIPPLDGSKLFFSIFPIRTEMLLMLEQFGFVILLFFIIFFSGPLGIFLNFMLNLFLGMTL
ncbi:MAG TPA: site-2 protease family protein [Candidatus Moranbacteria bacterium]|nr:site-2 protease family protein [Candidatus Moranbacteria bacterium]